MSTDTAEYWEDVKRPRPRNSFYHAKDCKCGHTHNHETEYIDDVECNACKLLLKASPPPPWMIPGNAPKYHYMTKAAAKRARKEDEFHARVGMCSCGSHWVVRKNKTTNTEFLGCSNYPDCKKTKAL